MTDDLINRLEAGEAISPVSAWDIVHEFPIWGTSSPEAQLFATALGGSLDAALALAERVLPGWVWSVGQGPGENAYGRLDTPDGCDYEEAYSKTAPLALCIAILRALKEPGDE